MNNPNIEQGGETKNRVSPDLAFWFLRTNDVKGHWTDILKGIQEVGSNNLTNLTSETLQSFT